MQGAGRKFWAGGWTLRRCIIRNYQRVRVKYTAFCEQKGYVRQNEQHILANIYYLGENGQLHQNSADDGRSALYYQQTDQASGGGAGLHACDT